MDKGEKEKNNKYVLFMIFGVILVCIIIMYIAMQNGGGTNYNKSINKGQKTEIKQNNNENTAKSSGREKTLIDMENTENVEIKDDGKENNSKALHNEKVFGMLKFSNIKLQTNGGKVSFTAKVENIGEQDFDAQDVILIFKDKDGNDIKRVNTHLGTVSKDKSNELSVSMSKDVTNAYDFVIEFEK